MFYIIVEKNRSDWQIASEQVFKSREEANIERIYLQPDCSDCLEVAEIV